MLGNEALQKLRSDHPACLSTANSAEQRMRMLDGATSCARLACSRNAATASLYNLDCLAALVSDTLALSVQHTDAGVAQRRKNCVTAIAHACECISADHECSSAGLLRLIKHCVEHIAGASSASKQCRSSLSQLCSSLSYRHQKSPELASALFSACSASDNAPRNVAAACELDETLASALLAEIAQRPAEDYNRLALHDAASMRAVSSLLLHLASVCPSAIVRNASSLRQHLGDDAYTLRAAIVSTASILLCSARTNGSTAGQKEDAAVLHHQQSLDGTNEDQNDGNAEEETVHSDENESSSGRSVSATKQSTSFSKPFDLNASTKQSLLDLIDERVHDAHSIVRTRALQALQALIENRMLPLGRWLQVYDISSARIMDKTQGVRKAAARCVGSMVQYNPFAPSLPVSPFESTLNEYSSSLEQRLHEVSEDKHTQGISGGINAPEQLSTDELQSLVASLDIATAFAKRLRDTVSAVCMLLDSGSSSDVVEAAPLVALFSHFQVDNSVECVRKMLALVFARDESVRDAVVTCADELFLSPADDAHEASSSLIALLQGAPLGSRMAVEHLMQRFVRSGRIPSNGSVLTKSLWIAAAGHGPCESDGNMQATALELLNYIVQAVPDQDMLDRSKLDILESGLRSATPEVVRWTLALLTHMPKPTDAMRGARSLLSAVFSHVLSLQSELEGRSWFACAEFAVNVVYKFHPAPEECLANLLARMVGRDGNAHALTVEQLARVVALTGAIAIRHVSYTEYVASRSNSGAQEPDDRASATEEGDLAVQVGVDTESSAADIEAHRECAESQLLADEVSESAKSAGIIAKLAPLVVHACTDQGLLQSCSLFRGVALLSLMRLMAIDKQFCEKHLRLLFTRLKEEECEGIRATGAVGIGDLAYRHPNVLEPWTEHLYGKREWGTGVHDRSEVARRQSLAVLSHLALADMMKIRLHVSKMALRLVDNSSSVASLAEYFFTELANKPSEPVYNLLPDILSNLSQEVELSKRGFMSIIQKLLHLIDKEKQGEKLVPKVCMRVGEAADADNFALARSLAYTASQLPLGERGFRKLESSCFKHIEYAITDAEIAQYIKDAAWQCVATSRGSRKIKSKTHTTGTQRHASGTSTTTTYQSEKCGTKQSSAEKSELELAVEHFCERVDAYVIDTHEQDAETAESTISAEVRAGD